MATAHAGTSACGTTGDVQRACDFSVSDFATIVTMTTYVDKSLLIRDVYNASSRILITAPRRFGKSTNLNMVKRFFEIEVDARGNLKTVQTTNNYKLFKEYNLEICKDVGFFNEHFGKHPVVYIDFKPLGSVDTPAEILDAFKVIVENSLNQHYYIFQNSLTEHVFSGITGFNVNDFRKYISDGITKDVDGLNLANSFKHLPTILNRVFGKKVFVLIDSYDAFLDSLVIKNKTYRKKVISFVKSSISHLLNNVNCVDRVFITGVIPVIGEEFLSGENNIECYHFLGSHPFTKSYGLTSAEVDMVLSKVIECDEERFDVKTTLNDYFNAYETRNQGLRLYNVISVLKYVGRRTVQSYWCERRYINKFKKCLKIEPIRQKLEELLLDYTFKLDTSQPLSITNVLKVFESIVTSDEDDEDEHLSIEVELFFTLLYHFGYLSVFCEYALSRGAVYVNIPSDEIKYELAKAVFDENRELYSNPRVNDILSDLDAFQPDATDLHKNIEKFVSNVSYWYKSNNFLLTHFLKCLFMNLVTRTDHSRVMRRKLPGLLAVLLKNKHQVAICVACGGGRRAESIHKKVTNYDGEDYIFHGFNDVRGKIIITVDCAGIAYSYYFKTGDSLREVRTLP